MQNIWKSIGNISISGGHEFSTSQTYETPLEILTFMHGVLVHISKTMKNVETCAKTYQRSSTLSTLAGLAGHTRSKMDIEHAGRAGCPPLIKFSGFELRNNDFV